jgi:hypothetical protein
MTQLQFVDFHGVAEVHEYQANEQVYNSQDQDYFFQPIPTALCSTDAYVH